MPGKRFLCSRCEYGFDVPYEPEECKKKPRCPRCGSYAINRQGCFGPGEDGAGDTGIFLP
ncbi:MAG: hypothetical protein SCK29_01265 [Bacillota bacterium]|nr:hypothetical protein [Bacillota bacterium]MDW7682730.1 hypothetical protein [Bacillota bacterium]